MRCLTRPVLAILAGWAALSTARAVPYVWTGIGPSDYQDQLTPPDDGTTDLSFGASLNHTVEFDDSFSASTLSFGGGTPYTVTSGDSGVLTVATGIYQLDSLDTITTFANNLDISITNGDTFDAGQGEIIIQSRVEGPGSLTLVTSGAGAGVFVFNNTEGGNTYEGDTTLGDGTNPPTIAFYNSAPFSSGTVNVLDGAVLIAHGTQTLANDFQINTASTANPLQFRSWDAPLTLTGDLVFFNNTVVDATFTDASIGAPDQSGQIVVPGAIGRYPVIFAGPLNASGGPKSVTFGGAGVSIVTGASNYTGGTVVLGSLVYGSAASLAASGGITVEAGGYVGMADNTAGAVGSLLSLLGTSTGAVGFDTLPGNETQTFSENYSLAGFSSTTVRFGSATSAVVTGTLTPQSVNTYQFGGGGGILFVESNLPNLTTSTALVLDSGTDLQPLTLFLSGNNSYGGNTTVNSGFLLFDGTGSIPTVGHLVAAGSSTAPGQSYIGYTEHAGTTPTAFLGAFNKAATWGIIGFDSDGDANPISALDLTGFNDGVFIGTDTTATITGPITGTTVTNGDQTANTLRFTATNTGQLSLNTVLADNGSPVSVVIGVPNEVSPSYSSGTVTLADANTYSGGTTMNAYFESGPTLLLGSSTALGSGSLTLTGGGVSGLGVTQADATIANPITLVDLAGSGSTLALVGENTFTLSGTIAGDSTTTIQLYNPSPLVVTLAAANPNFSGSINILNGTLMLANNQATGTATLDFPFGSTGIAEFTGSALAPVISNIQGATGNLVLPDGAVLTIDTTSDNGSNQGVSFGGTISGTEEGSTSASLVINNTAGAGPNAVVQLNGSNNYTGGTTVQNYALLALSYNNAAGSGPVTVATLPSGGLALNSGVTFTNSLNYETGTLAGYGTFSPSNLVTIPFGANQTVYPGLPPAYIGHDYPGVLTFTTNVIFDTGGTFNWLLQDGSVAAGASSIVIEGGLSVTAVAGGFTINLTSLDSGGAIGNAANFNPAVPASWVLATVGSTVTGFNANQFSFNTANFEGGSLPASDFSVSITAGPDLTLDFTPVPEPSTYALLGAGAALVAAAAGLRRKRVAR